MWIIRKMQLLCGNTRYENKAVIRVLNTFITALFLTTIPILFY